MYYKLPKPVITKKIIDQTLKLIPNPPKEMLKLLRDSENPQYRYWDTLRHKAKVSGIKPEVGWLFVDFSRKVNSRKNKTPIQDEEGNFFHWNSLNRFDSFFHELDMTLGGSVKVSGIELDDKYRQEFITRGVMEEAIASAQLEGANTARKVAKKMLLDGRRPGTKSEKMIVNNYKAMLLVEEEYKNSELSLDMLLRLHEILTVDTLDDENDCGRFRAGKGDDVYVEDAEGIIYHKGPKPSFVNKELEKLIEFANQISDSKQFTHPVVKAVILHFWLAFLHPFVDGNGRLARTLFYWSLLKDGYWGFTYLPISKVIKESDTQYGMSYVYSEQDDNDFTYFLDYNVRKIELALKNFREYVTRKTNEQVVMRSNLVGGHGLNERQVMSLQYLHANMNEFITTASYQKINNISGPTAAKDVKELTQKGFIKRVKVGRQVKYYPELRIKTIFKK
jgi:Fic family protein